MTRYLTRRAIQLIPLFFIITIMTFGLYQLAPGGPEKVLLQGELISSPVNNLCLKKLLQQAVALIEQCLLILPRIDEAWGIGQYRQRSRFGP